MTALNHPFNFAYAPQHPADIAAIEDAYVWTAESYDIKQPMPSVLVVNHDHMQRAVQQANHQVHIFGQVYGWYSQTYRTVFISDRIKPRRSVREAAVVVHEFVHYFQDITQSEMDVHEMEREADEYMNLYVGMLTRNAA